MLRKIMLMNQRGIQVFKNFNNCLSHIYQRILSLYNVQMHVCLLPVCFFRGSDTTIRLCIITCCTGKIMFMPLP